MSKRSIAALAALLLGCARTELEGFGAASSGGAGGNGAFGGTGGSGGTGGESPDSCYVWGESERLEMDDTGPSGAARIAMNGHGAAVVVWGQAATERTKVWARRYAPEAGWEEPRLLGNDGVHVNDLRVAIDDDGSAIALWQATEAAPNLRSRHYDVASGIWEATEFANRDGAAPASTPDLALAGEIGVAVWNQPDGAESDLWANRFTPDGRWGDAVPIQRAGDTNPPAIAMNRSGAAVVVWSQWVGLEQRVWSSRSEAGVEWTRPELIQEVVAQRGQAPNLAIDPDGNAIAVWDQYPDGSSSVSANRLAAGEGWGDAEVVDATSVEANVPRVGMDASGNAVAVWRQVDGDVYEIWSNRYTLDAGWDTPERISEAADYAHRPEVAVGPAGHGVAVWTQDDAEGNHVWSNRYAPGVGWCGAQIVDVGMAGSSADVDVAVDGEGNAIVVWSRANGGTWDVWANIASVVNL